MDQNSKSSFTLPKPQQLPVVHKFQQLLLLNYTILNIMAFKHPYIHIKLKTLQTRSFII